LSAFGYRHFAPLALAGQSTTMVLKYLSGEEIRKGDRVLFHREPGQIELVVDKLTCDAAMDWYMQEFGGGVMIREPKHFGRVFIQAESLPTTEDLEFVSRADD
jgi:hypothetical protein